TAAVTKAAAPALASLVLLRRRLSAAHSLRSARPELVPGPPAARRASARPRRQAPRSLPAPALRRAQQASASSPDARESAVSPSTALLAQRAELRLESRALIPPRAFAARPLLAAARELPSRRR